MVSAALEVGVPGAPGLLEVVVPPLAVYLAGRREWRCAPQLVLAPEHKSSSRVAGDAGRG